MALSANARPGLRRAERISERTASLYGASASSRRISTSNSRSRGGSSAMSASPPASTARSMSLMWAAKIGERRAELGAQLRQLQAGAAGDFGEADLLEALLGEQRHQRVDGLVAVGGAARRRARRAALRARLRLAGHGGLPSFG